MEAQEVVDAFMGITSGAAHQAALNAHIGKIFGMVACREGVRSSPRLKKTNFITSPSSLRLLRIMSLTVVLSTQWQRVFAPTARIVHR